MKKNKVKRMLALMLATFMVVVPLGGCGKNTATSDETLAQTSESQANAGSDSSDGFHSSVAAGTSTVDSTLETALSSNTAGADFIDYIKTNFAATSALDEDYNQPMYGLPADYVFEFECSEEAGYIAYDAFEVYDNSDYENISNMSYSKNTYENGKIRVEPDGALYLDENGSRNIDDGTWGSLNQLYLVQYIDLTTGEKLDRPIVTPFSIQHEVNAPSISQGVDSNNSYVLSWEEVPGAVEYRVYEHFDSLGYKLECKTTNTSVSVEEFESQKRTENYSDLLMQDLENAGYDSAVTNTDGIFHMNSAVKYDADLDDGYFVVVAVDANGKQSGISNIIDVRDIANKLPYTISDTTIDVNISSVEDIPAYVDVEMVDGSVQRMVIDYHGAQTYIYPDDELKMSIQAHVANTLFNKFVITLHGMKHEDVMANSSYVTQRQDELLSKISGVQEPELHISNTPSEESNEVIESMVAPTAEPTEAPTVAPTVVPTAEPTVAPTTEPTEAPTAAPTVVPTVAPTVEPTIEPTAEPTEAPTVVPTAEPTEAPTAEPTAAPTQAPTAEPTAVPTEAPTQAPSNGTEEANMQEQLMNEVAGLVKNNLNILGVEKVERVLYATSDLEAWMAMCLIAQSQVIPVPVEVFPDAANVDYVFTVLMEAYRQNPTCGFICDARYIGEYQALVIKYQEDAEVRLDKTKQEIDAAYNIASQITSADMSDYDKVLAINEYFRINASYDFDSMSTDIEDFSTLSEQFMDAHSPYGIICNNYGVCESYSEAFVLTARFAGLEAMCEVGAMFGGGHEWNRVKVDGSWCILDITNNDNDVLTNGLFNVTDSQVSGILVPDNSAIMNGQNYAAMDSSKEYYYVNGKATSDLTQVADMVIAQLQTEDEAVVRVPAGTSDEQLQEIVRQLIQEKGLNLSEAGAMYGVLYVAE